MPPRTSSDVKDTRPTIAKKKHALDKKKWDLAMAHLKSKNLDLAKKVLTELTDHPNPFNQKASKALQEVNIE